MPYKDKEINRTYQREWARKNSDARNERMKRRRKEMKEFLLSLKDKCADCGYDECKNALCFHHLDSSIKTDTVSRIARSPGRQKAVLVEVAKCIVLCSNCHSRRHCPNGCK